MSVAFLQEQSLFFAALAIVTLLPGWAVINAFFRGRFTAIETFVFAMPISLASVDFLLIGFAKTGQPITTHSILILLASFSCALFLVSSRQRFFGNRWKHEHRRAHAHLEKNNPEFALTKRQGWLILLILILTVAVKTLYLSQVILPTATDMGHHMYWAKSISVTGELPRYEERNVIEENGGYRLDDPVAIDDFIIGEHLVFAAVALLAHRDFVSYFPILTLFLLHLFSVLAIFVFVWRIFASKHFSRRGSAKTLAIIALFLIGPLYAIASPQAKFASGGVIGNTLGNLFIPLILLCSWRAFKEKDAPLLALAFFLTFGLAYSHHLSTLVFLFVLFFAIVTFVFLNVVAPALSAKSFRHGLHVLRGFLLDWWRLFWQPAPMTVALCSTIFFFFVLAPSYADPHSLDTALGSPIKATRTGLTFSQLTFSIGESRFGLGLFGAVLLFALHFRKRNALSDRYATAFLLAWAGALLVMTIRPNWLFLDIPSNRIGTYALFPFTVLAALTLAQCFSIISERSRRDVFSVALFFLSITFLVFGGMYDNSQSFLEKTKSQEAIQTYRVSDYVASHTDSNDIVLTDHNYIVADSWMKLSFLRGYTYPLSRGYFKRYEDDTNPREQCTLRMIASPNTELGQKCFAETGTSIVIVNPRYDAAQFEKSAVFSAVYRSDDTVVYLKKK
jgi:hypothetical protein